jgi:hypothetical protein
MNILPLLGGTEPSPAAAVARAESVSAGVRSVADEGAGPASTFWISPPGQFFSVLHEVSQRYPVELQQAIVGLDAPKLAATSPTPDAPTTALMTSVIVYGQPRRRAAALEPYAGPSTVAPWALPASESPSVGTMQRLIAMMHDLADKSPSEFGDVAHQIAAGFASVSSSAAGPDALGMATLAAQLELAAQTTSPEAHPLASVPSLSGRVAAVHRIDE